MTTGMITLNPSVNVGVDTGVSGTIALHPKVEEFHLLGQHDQFKHAPGGSDGGGINAAKIAGAIGAVVVGAGLVYYAQKKAPGSVAWSAVSKRSNKLEATLMKGGSELDDAVAKKVALIKSGKHTERDVRDLAVLQGKFLHQDDASAFLRRLAKKKYSEAERTALWEYAGLYLDDAGLVSKGPVQRFHGPLRRGDPLTKAQQKTMKMVDKAIRKNKLPRDVTLYRGVRLHKDNVAFLRSKAGKGVVVRDDAPMFTGLTEARATPHHQGRFYDTDRSVLFEIRAPKGAPAIHSPYGESIKGRKVPIPLGHVPGIQRWPKRFVPKRQPYVRAPFIEHLNKEEIVLPAGVGLKIIKTTMGKDGVLRVVAELVE